MFLCVCTRRSPNPIVPTVELINQLVWESSRRAGSTTQKGGRSWTGRWSFYSFPEMWLEVMLWKIRAINQSYWIQPTKLIAINLMVESRGKGVFVQITGPYPHCPDLHLEKGRQRTEEEVKEKIGMRRVEKEIIYCTALLWCQVLEFQADYMKLRV